MELLTEIAKHLENGDTERVYNLCSQAIADKVSSDNILNNGLLAGMDIVGQKFRNHEIFLPDVLMAAKAMHAGMYLLKPLLVKDGIPLKGKVVIGSIQGDLHDIGKNLVGIMLKGAGYEVIDLGNDVAPVKFVSVAREEKASVIGMSALLTTTMPAMKEVVDILKQEKLDRQIKTIIGGAPVSQKFAEEIGVNGYGYDAGNAIEKIEKLMAG